MNNKELLQRLEASHQWTANAILQLRELIKNERWATEEQLQRLVVLGVLAQAQYEDITGEAYPV